MLDHVDGAPTLTSQKDFHRDKNQPLIYALTKDRAMTLLSIGPQVFQGFGR
jgi:hypothetical protein